MDGQIIILILGFDGLYTLVYSMVCGMNVDGNGSTVLKRMQRTSVGALNE